MGGYVDHRQERLKCFAARLTTTGAGVTRRDVSLQRQIQKPLDCGHVCVRNGEASVLSHSLRAAPRHGRQAETLERRRVTQGEACSILIPTLSQTSVTNTKCGYHGPRNGTLGTCAVPW